MIIKLSPRVCDDAQPAISVSGDVLTIDGTVLDFSPLSEGEALPSEAVDSPWLQQYSEVTRVGGDVCLTLILPICWDAPEASRFPEPIIVDADGPVTLPAYSVEDAE